jgi:FlaA1/EpsC-like NDP-sugar epimerase
LRPDGRDIAKSAIDASAITAACWVAFILRFDGHVPAFARADFWRLLPLLLVLRAASLAAFQMHTRSWRHFGLGDLVCLAGALLAGSALFVLPARWLAPHLPWGILIAEPPTSLLLLAGARAAVRLLFAPSRDTRRGVLLVGAGRDAAELAHQMQFCSKAGRLVGFVDDSPDRRGRRFWGARVLGGLAELPTLVARHQVDDILICADSLHQDVSRAFRLCEQTRARVRLLQSNGTASLTHVRDFRAEDLLPRLPVQKDWQEITSYLRGERVMVTGAGGSIGSELCRQICKADCAALLLVGRGENSIFDIEDELRADLGFAAQPVIADIGDQAKMEHVFSRLRPTVVFHAAAHKHVPLMEAHPDEAVKNNVLATLGLCDLALRYGVKTFILISTDKAVNPSSVMGAAKRLAEMIISLYGERRQTSHSGGSARFLAVRFGNVLGSRGSVVPLMRRQIARGGPVTVTHPEATRYFMTVQEAAQLVIRAGAIGQNGQIICLDMGHPMRILDLANALIRLSGLVPGQDIPIVFSGIRPGEKIHESLFTDLEEQVIIKHEGLFMARAPTVDPDRLIRGLESLAQAARMADHASVRRLISELVPDARLSEPAPLVAAEPVVVSPSSGLHSQPVPAWTPGVAAPPPSVIGRTLGFAGHDTGG